MSQSSHHRDQSASASVAQRPRPRRPSNNNDGYGSHGAPMPSSSSRMMGSSSRDAGTSSSSHRSGGHLAAPPPRSGRGAPAAGGSSSSNMHSAGSLAVGSSGRRPSAGTRAAPAHGSLRSPGLPLGSSSSSRSGGGSSGAPPPPRSLHHLHGSSRGGDSGRHLAPPPARSASSSSQSAHPSRRPHHPSGRRPLESVNAAGPHPPSGSRHGGHGNQAGDAAASTATPATWSEWWTNLTKPGANDPAASAGENGAVSGNPKDPAAARPHQGQAIGGTPQDENTPASSAAAAGEAVRGFFARIFTPGEEEEVDESVAIDNALKSYWAERGMEPPSYSKYAATDEDVARFDRRQREVAARRRNEKLSRGHAPKFEARSGSSRSGDPKNAGAAGGGGGHSSSSSSAPPPPRLRSAAAGAGARPVRAPGSSRQPNLR